MRFPRGMVIPGAVTLATLGLLAFSASGAEPASPPVPVPIPPPPVPVPIPPPPVPTPVPDMSGWDDAMVLSEAKRVILDQSDGKLTPADAPYVCALSRRTESVALPFGSALLLAERLRSISVSLGGTCSLL